MSIKNQVDINATETVKAKLIFKREDQSQGVAIKVYHTYNGIFNAYEFMKEMFKNQQKISFSGARASHKNGALERAINMVVTTARTMLMHAALICPKDKCSTDIWSVVMYYTVWV